MFVDLFDIVYFVLFLIDKILLIVCWWGVLCCRFGWKVVWFDYMLLVYICNIEVLI